MNGTYFWNGEEFLFEGDFENAKNAFEQVWYLYTDLNLETEIAYCKACGCKGLAIDRYELGWE